MADPHIAWALIACALAFLFALIQLAVNTGKPQNKPPPDHPMYPPF